jgi:TonB-linked SusC/RagA family outer membrane protein
MKRSLLLLLLFLLFTGGIVLAQTQSVKGTVTDAADGSALPGVSIAVKGTTRGAVTDIDGNFTIAATTGEVLVFNYTGYLPYEVKIGNRTNLNIVMSQDQNQLEGVVITAMGLEQKKEALGYSTTTIGGVDVQESQRDNWMNALASRLPGATIGSTSGTPGASSSIMLRGVSSLFGSNQPLMVIDGVQTDNSTLNQGSLVSDGSNRNNDFSNRAADLNPNDIESITVLKGPEAAALYGAVAGNGAIIITTKKGQQGDTRVSYDNNFRFETTYRIPEVQNIYGRGSSGVFDPLTRLTRGPRYTDNIERFNNVDNFFRTGTGQNHNLAIEGGTDKITYRWSNGYRNTQGVIPGTSLRNFTTGLTGSARIRKNMKIETRFNYNNSVNNKIIRGEEGVLLNLLSWPANEDILAYETPEGARRRLFDNVNIAEADNPLFSLNKNLNQDKVSRFRGSVTLTYDPTKWLTIRGIYGGDRFTQTGVLVAHPESNFGFIARGSIEGYTLINRLDDFNATARARAKIGKLGGSLTLGSQTIMRYTDVFSSVGEQFFDPGFYSINNTLPTTRRARSSITRSNLAGVFGQFDLNYDEKVYITLMGRNDWTSTLPVNNRSYFYPGVSTSILLHKFLPKNDVLNFLKIRGSFAQVGKDAPPHRTASALTSQLTTGGGYAYGVFGGNAALRPEITTAREVGFEAKFFKERVSLDGSYFFRRSVDQITPPRTSYGTGFILSFINSGILDNWGYEASLGLVPVKTSKLTWSIDMNFTRLNSKAVELPLDLPEFYVADTWLFGNVRNSIFKGGPLTTFGATQYLRNNNGDVLINPSNGLPTIDPNFTVAGDRNPDFVIGLNNRFSWKGLNFNFLFDIRKGGDVYNATGLFLFQRGFSAKYGLDRETPVIFKGVLRDGRENSDSPTPNNMPIIPLTNNNFFSAFAPSDFIEKDVNWVRLREVTMSYSFPANWVRSSKVFRSASMFVTGTDLFIITNYTGADPMVAGNSAAVPGSGALAYDLGSLPNPRAVSFGFRVGF